MLNTIIYTPDTLQLGLVTSLLNGIIINEKQEHFCHNGYHMFQLQPPYLIYYQLLVTHDKFDTTGKSVLVYSKVAVIEAFILSELLWWNPWSLPHRGRVTHICAPINQTTVSLDNGLSPVRRQAIIWADGDLFFVEPLGIK